MVTKVAFKLAGRSFFHMRRNRREASSRLTDLNSQWTVVSCNYLNESSNIQNEVNPEQECYLVVYGGLECIYDNSSVERKEKKKKKEDSTC